MRTATALPIALAVLTAFLMLFGGTAFAVPVHAPLPTAHPEATVHAASPSSYPSPSVSPVNPSFPLPVYSTSCLNSKGFFPLGQGAEWSQTAVVTGPCDVTGSVSLSHNLVVNGSVSFNGATITLYQGVTANAVAGCTPGLASDPCDWIRSISIENGGNLSIVNSTLTVANTTGPTSVFPIVLDHYTEEVNGPTSINSAATGTCLPSSSKLVLYNSNLLNGIPIDWGSRDYSSSQSFMLGDTSFLCSLNSYVYADRVHLNGTLHLTGATAFLDNIQQDWYTPDASYYFGPGDGVYLYPLLNFSGANPAMTLGPVAGTNDNTMSLGQTAELEFQPAYHSSIFLTAVSCAYGQTDSFLIPTLGYSRVGCVSLAPPLGYRTVVPAHTIYANKVNVTFASTAYTSVFYATSYIGFTCCGPSTTASYGINDTFVLSNSTLDMLTGDSTTMGYFDDQEASAGTDPVNATFREDTLTAAASWNATLLAVPFVLNSNLSSTNHFDSALAFLMGGNVTVDRLSAALNSTQESTNFPSSGSYFGASLGTIALSSWGPTFDVNGSTFTDTAKGNSWDEPNLLQVGMPVATTSVPVVRSTSTSSFPYISNTLVPTRPSFLTLTGNTFTALGLNNSGFESNGGNQNMLCAQVLAHGVATDPSEGGGAGVGAQLIALGNTFHLAGSVYSCVDTAPYGAFSWTSNRAVSIVDGNTATMSVTAQQPGGTPLGFYVDNSLTVEGAASAPTVFPLVNLTANTVSITDTDANVYNAIFNGFNVAPAGTDPSFFFEQTAKFWNYPGYTSSTTPTTTSIVSAVDNAIVLTAPTVLRGLSNWSSVSTACATSLNFDGYAASGFSPTQTSCFGDVIGFAAAGEGVMSNMVGNTMSITGWGVGVAGQWFSRIPGGVFNSNVYPQTGVDAPGYVTHGPWMPDIMGNNLTLGMDSLFITGAPKGVSADTSGYFPSKRMLISQEFITYQGTTAYDLYIGVNHWTSAATSFFAFQPFNTVVSGAVLTPRVLLSSIPTAPTTTTPEWEMLYLGGAAPRGMLLATGTGIYSTTNVEFGDSFGLDVEPGYNFVLPAGGFSYVTPTSTVGVLAGGAVVWVANYEYNQANLQNGGGAFGFPFSVNYNNTPLFSLPPSTEGAWDIHLFDGNYAKGGYWHAEHFDLVTYNSTPLYLNVGLGSIPTGVDAIALQQNLRANGALIVNNTVPELNPGVVTSLPILTPAGAPSAPPVTANTVDASIPGALSLCSPSTAFSSVTSIASPAACLRLGTDPISDPPVLVTLSAARVSDGVTEVNTTFMGGNGSFVLGEPYLTAVANAGNVTAYVGALRVPGFLDNMTEEPALYAGWEVERTLVSEGSKGYILYSSLLSNAVSTVPATVYNERFGKADINQSGPDTPVTLQFSGLYRNDTYSYYLDGAVVTHDVPIATGGVFNVTDSVGNHSFVIANNAVPGPGPLPSGLSNTEMAEVLLLTILLTVAVAGGLYYYFRQRSLEPTKKETSRVRHKGRAT